MTVTLTIQNNDAYCDAHLPDSIKMDEDLSCQCAESTGVADDHCPVCFGTGVLPNFKIYPFVLELSNTNFTLIMSALGLSVDTYGEILPHKLWLSLRSLSPLLLERSIRTGDNEFYLGVDTQQSERYIKELTSIVHEALRREELIIWD